VSITTAPRVFSLRMKDTSCKCGS